MVPALEGSCVITSETFLVFFLQFWVLDVRRNDDTGALFVVSFETQIDDDKNGDGGGVGLRRPCFTNVKHSALESISQHEFTPQFLKCRNPKFPMGTSDFFQ